MVRVSYSERKITCEEIQVEPQFAEADDEREGDVLPGHNGQLVISIIGQSTIAEALLIERRLRAGTIHKQGNYQR